MKIIKTNKKSVKILILTGIYAVFAFVVSISVIMLINNSIVTHTGDSEINSSIAQTNNISNNKSADTSSSMTSASEEPATSESVAAYYNSGIKLTNIPDSAVNISFSYDGKYCIYLYNGEIYIKDIASDIIINKISDSASITNPILINDRNIIIYFTLKDISLNVKSYDIVNNMETLQKTINIPAGATIKNVDYSTLTNLIFINIESGNGTNLINTMYYLNIMKRLKTFRLETLINKMVLLNKTLSLYFEDKNNNLSCYPNPISGFDKKKIRLLGCDSNDNVFIESLDNKSTIYVLKDEKIDKTINLDDPVYIEVYTNNIGVYLVYGNYILNLAGDINKKMLLDKGLKFIGIGGDKIYFRDSNDNIISQNNSI